MQQSAQIAARARAHEDRDCLVGGMAPARRDRALLMSALNVTPDSFSDGGHYFDSRAAIARAGEMIEQGADILDIGAESTRPGSAEISAEEELARLRRYSTR